MPEETARTLNHFALWAFAPGYWALPTAARANLHREWLAGQCTAGPLCQSEKEGS